jgi:acetoin utilization protein AcuB
MDTILMKEHMTRHPYVVGKEQNIQEVAELMFEAGVRHLPVVYDGRLLGIVSERELKVALALGTPSNLKAEDIMKKNVYVAYAEELLSDVALDMANEKVGSAVIVNHDHEVMGIFTTTDALKILSSKLEDGFEASADDARDEYYDEFLWMTR